MRSITPGYILELKTNHKRRREGAMYEASFLHKHNLDYVELWSADSIDPVFLLVSLKETARQYEETGVCACNQGFAIRDGLCVGCITRRYLGHRSTCKHCLCGRHRIVMGTCIHCLHP